MIWWLNHWLVNDCWLSTWSLLEKLMKIRLIWTFYREMRIIIPCAPVGANNDIIWCKIIVDLVARNPPDPVNHLRLHQVQPHARREELESGTELHNPHRHVATTSKRNDTMRIICKHFSFEPIIIWPPWHLLISQRLQYSGSALKFLAFLGNCIWNTDEVVANDDLKVSVSASCPRSRSSRNPTTWPVSSPGELSP